jgi:ABC-type uncharacterized transport system fused permease/ATPase subunit
MHTHMRRRIRCCCRHEDLWHVSRTDQLSVGEVQRLAVARLLLERPQVAVLDEATSAVGSEAALALYGAIRAAGIATLTLAQQSTELRQCHDLIVTILCDGSGGWTTEAGHRPPRGPETAELIPL